MRDERKEVREEGKNNTNVKYQPYQYINNIGNFFTTPFF
jgi:hypothetical protein